MTYAPVATNEFRIAYAVSFEKGQRMENVLHFRYSRSAEDPEAKWQGGNVIVSFAGMTRVGGPPSSRQACVPTLRADQLPGGVPVPGDSVYAMALNAEKTKVYGLSYPHAEFFDMRQRVIHGWGAVDGAAFAAVLCYAAVYVTAVLATAALVLGRRRV